MSAIRFADHAVGQHLLEAELLRRMAEPFAKMGDAKAARLVSVLEKMLSDGVISDEESKRISLILQRL